MKDEEPRHTPFESETGSPGLVVRVLTWNINGLRGVAASHGGLKSLLDQFHADIVKNDLARAQGYHCLFTHCKVRRKPSYSGVATFVRSDSGLRTIASTTALSDAAFFGSPGSFAGGLNPDRLRAVDSEGRVLVTDHGHFVLFNVYAPCISSGDEDEKTEARREFKRDFLTILQARIAELRERGRGVVLVGDLNACASQLDHGYTITDAEFYASNWSKWIRGMLGLDSSDSPRLMDCFRRLHPDRKGAFTCWNTQTGARENNYGTRIDYIIASASFADRALQTCDIMPDILGSDHCPVRAKFVVRSPAGLEADVFTGTGDGGVLGGKHTKSGGAQEWPEHPPECSCFYRELTAKQEKLAKYFVAGGSKTTENNEGENETLGDKVAGNRCISQTPFTVGSIRVEAPVASNGGGRFGTQGRRVGAAAPASSSRGTKGRAAGSRGGRQSKLIFASPAPTHFASGTLSGGQGGVAEINPGKDTRTEIERFPSSAPPEHQTVHMGEDAEQALSSRDGDERQRQGGSSVGGPNGASSGSNCGGDSGSASNAGGVGAGLSGGSAEAWKAIFREKKSAPTCQHGEPSIQRTVLKPGPNHNRRFYTCARSAGNWPSDRNARCSFFEWRLDGVRGYKVRPPPRDANAKKQRRSL